MRRKRGEMTEEVKLHCPHEGCLYWKGSERYFTKKFNLKQHLLKVHAEKSFLCKKCKLKTFASMKLLAYHEKNCGINWTCSCGLSYDMRETLLTHVRRTQHTLPQNIQPPKKRESPAVRSRLALFEGDIHPSYPGKIVSVSSGSQVECGPVCNPPLPRQFRPILPKPSYKIINGLSSTHRKLFNSDYTDPVIYKVENTTQTEGEFHVHEPSHFNTSSKKDQNTQIGSRSVETQTSRRSILKKPSSKKSLQVESRASQCYVHNENRKSASRSRDSVRLESIETQTTEIILGKMKRALKMNKKQLDKSACGSNTDRRVADVSAQSVLSCLDMLLNSRWSVNKSVKCSSGTQTSPRCKRARETLDSQAGTDQAHSNENDFGMLSLLATVCQRMATEMISQQSRNYTCDEDSCSTHNIRDIFAQKTEPVNLPKRHTNSPRASKKRRLPDSSDILTQSSSPTPSSLDIETQTREENALSSFLSSNMETQTTLDDELLFPELELSDIQTQTPWPDFLDFYNTPNNVNETESLQLSAEIQTDITGIDFADWHNNFEDLVTDTQTQTNYTNPTSPILELTSSYTQTLDDMCHFFDL